MQRVKLVWIKDHLEISGVFTNVDSLDDKDWQLIPVSDLNYKIKVCSIGVGEMQLDYSWFIIICIVINGSSDIQNK